MGQAVKHDDSLLKHGMTSKDIIDIERDPYGVQHL